MENSLIEFVGHFDEFADNTQSARKKSERDRDYYDHKQLSQTEVDALKKRKQPPVISNRIQPKIMYMLGVERQTRTDPKGYPRTPNDAEAAEAVTDALRYVADNAGLDICSSEVFENEAIEGTGAAIVQYDPEKQEIKIDQVQWDRLYWDIHSRKPDFSDASRKGIVLWMDLDEAVQRWPDKEKELQDFGTKETEHDTFNDKPGHMRWSDSKRQRIMVLEEYFLQKGKWHRVVFCKGCFLEEPEVSPYLDEDGLPCCIIEMQSAFVDREGNRYGVARAYIDSQDEINKRRSKALHLLNVNQTIGEKGAVSDINKMKQEKAKPDGHIEVNQGQFEKFTFVDQNAEIMGHLQFMQIAMNEIDATGANAAMTGKDDRAMSGRARQAVQQSGILELGPIYDSHRMWKKRMYRQIWGRVKQFWDEEKWIRVTDDESNLKFVGLNQPITVGQQIMAHAEQTGQEIPQEYLNDPRMNQVVEVKNQIAEIDLDIILEESPDVVTMQHETFEMVMQAVQSSQQALPMETLIELMPGVPNKKQLLDKLKGDPEQAQANQQKQQQAEQIQLTQVETELENTAADTLLKKASAQDKMASAQERLQPNY